MRPRRCPPVIFFPPSPEDVFSSPTPSWARGWGCRGAPRGELVPAPLPLVSAGTVLAPAKKKGGKKGNSCNSGVLVPFGKAWHHSFRPRRRKRKVGGMGLGAHKLPPGMAAVPLAGGQLCTCHLQPQRVAGTNPWWQTGHDDTACATHRCPTRSLPRGLCAVDDVDHLHGATHLCAHHSTALHTQWGCPRASPRPPARWPPSPSFSTAGMLCLAKDHAYHGAAVPGLQGRGHGSAWGHHSTWGQSSAWPSVAALSPTTTICHPDTHPASVRVSSSHGAPTWGCCTSGSWRIWTPGMAVKS